MTTAMPTDTPTWVVTGPTSGFGRATAFELARQGRVVLVGRSAEKLATVKAEIERKGGDATIVVSDFADVASLDFASSLGGVDGWVWKWL